MRPGRDVNISEVLHYRVNARNHFCMTVHSECTQEWKWRLDVFRNMLKEAWMAGLAQ